MAPPLKLNYKLSVDLLHYVEDGFAFVTEFGHDEF